MSEDCCVKEKKVPERGDIEEKYKWDLSVVYSSLTAWESDYASVDSLVKQACSFRGHLADVSGEPLVSFLKVRRSLLTILNRLLEYSGELSDEDRRNASALELHSRATSLETQVDAELSWVVPEILAIPDDVLSKLRQVEEVKPFNRFLDMCLHEKDHTLSPELEKILSLSGDVLLGPMKAFDALDSVDLVFPSIETEDGVKTQVSQANYIQILESKNRSVRKAAFDAYYGEYRKYVTTFAALLDSQVRGLIFNARARKYQSTLEASLFPDVIPVSVYKSLVQAMHESIDVFYRYVALRKKRLGLEKLDMYDQYVSIVPGDNHHFTYEEACDLVREAVRPLGEEYGALVDKVIKSRWIDVFETKGKCTGAHSCGGNDVPPYILMNFTGNLESVFTLAHEMGHSIHTMLSAKNQQFEYMSYVLFVAEIASTLNECLLFHYLMEKAIKENDVQMQATLLNSRCDDFKGTVFRQVMFAEFEMLVNEMVENEGASSKDKLCKMYYDLNKFYYGPDVEADEQISYEWCRIPHFYYNFYVYKYATSFCVALNVSEQILAGNKNMTKNYLKFLSSGCSQDPLDLIKSYLGIDLTKPDCVKSSIENFDGVISQLDKLLDSNTI